MTPSRSDSELPPPALALSVGDSHEVVLPGLGTAGYRWDSELSGDTEALSLEWRRGMSADEARGRPVGASAPERLSITANAPGHATIRLRQARPWESGPARAEHVIEIDIAPEQ